MSRPRKIVIGLIGCAFAVFILLLAVVLIGPTVVDTHLVKAWVRSELKKTADVEIDFEHLILDFLPHPHLISNRVMLSIPPGVQGKAATVTVQPENLPLFLGKIHIAAFHLESAKLVISFTLNLYPAQLNRCYV